MKLSLHVVQYADGFIGLVRKDGSVLGRTALLSNEESDRRIFRSWAKRTNPLMKLPKVQPVALAEESGDLFLDRSGSDNSMKRLIGY